MHLPFLSLSIGEAATRRWLRAVGERPDLPTWKGVGRRKHAWLHDLALAADGYESVYEERPAAELMAQDQYSVEHVVPRSKIDDASDAESDPFAWVMASRKANANRSHHHTLAHHVRHHEALHGVVYTHHTQGTHQDSSHGRGRSGKHQCAPAAPTVAARVVRRRVHQCEVCDHQLERALRSEPEPRAPGERV